MCMGTHGGDTCILKHTDVWQKPARYCKAVTLHLKRNTLKEREPACSCKGHRFDPTCCGALSLWAISTEDVCTERVPCHEQKPPLAAARDPAQPKIIHR